MTHEIYRFGDLIATIYTGPEVLRSRSRLRVQVSAGADHVTLSAEDALQLGRALHTWAVETLGAGVEPVREPDAPQLRDVEDSLLELTRETINLADYLGRDPTLSGVTRTAHALRERAEATRAVLSAFLQGVPVGGGS